VDLQSLNLAPAEEITPLITYAPTPMRRTPSLPVDSADPLNALPLPPEFNDNPLKSLANGLEASYKVLWSKLSDPPATLEDVRKLLSRPFVNEETIPTEKHDNKSFHKLIVGNETKSAEDPNRGNILSDYPRKQAHVRTSGFRTLGTSLSRPFSSRTVTPTPTPKQREMHDISSTTEGLSGTQSRQLFSSRSDSGGKTKRVDSKLLTADPMDLRIGDVALIVKELRRVVAALDELGGFED
jgi:hypothetical protein